MSEFDKIINQIQREIFCPVCKRKYNLKEIRMRGFLDDLLILETFCNNNHAPAIILFMIKPIFGKTAKSKSISSKDVIDFKTKISEFNDDLKNLLK